MDLELTLKETITVRPYELQAANTQTIELSGLDRISPAMLYTVFFYKSRLKNDGESPVSSRERKGLSKGCWFLGIQQQVGLSSMRPQGS